MNQTSGSNLRSQKGQALIVAILLSLGVTVVVGSLLSGSLSTDRLLKGPRVRSAMMAAQQRLKLLASTPSSFDCPGGSNSGSGNSNSNNSGPGNNNGSGNGAGVSGMNGCKLVAFPLQELNQYFPQGSCPSSTPCGVEVKNLAFTNGRISARIEYTGSDLNFQPTNVDVPVPKEILQASQSDCFSKNPATPVFAGYNNDGSLNCRAIAGNCSDPGQFVVSVDPKSLRVTCGIFQDLVGCDPDEYMTGLKWDGLKFVETCAARPDPFAKFSFSPTIASNTASTLTQAPGPEPKNSCVAPTTTTTTTTSTTLPSGPGPTLPPPPPPSGYSNAKYDDPSCPPQNTGLSGGGVWACSVPLNGSNYVNNSCDLGTTGGRCCPADFSQPPHMWKKGGVNSGGGSEDVNLKCVDTAYCAANPSRCVTR